jgi:hypothetical protein
MSEEPESAAIPSATPEERKFRIAPVCFVMPEGHLPDPFFVYQAAHEKLVLASYVENRDGDAAAILSRRLKNLKRFGTDFVLERRKLVKIGGRGGALMIVSTGNGKDKYTVGLCLVGMKARRVWDARYEFEFPGEGGTDEFENILADFRFPDSVPPTAASPIAEDIQDVDLFGLRAVLPIRLRRTTAYTFKDSAAGVSWEVDAGWRSSGISTIEPERDTPMIKEVRRQDISQDSAAGTSILYRCTNAQTGGLGDSILRAEVIIARQARAIFRGRAPENAAERLDADLEFLLRHATLEQEI